VESSLNELLNKLIIAHKEYEIKDGVEISKAPDYMSLTKKIREAAEDMLNLVLTNSMCQNKPALKLNPLYQIFGQNKDSVKNVISKSYENTPINDLIIKEITEIASKENSSRKDEEIYEKLSQIRQQETAHILTKNMYIYENQKLTKVLEECVEKLSTLHKKVDDSFDKLENGFKNTTLTELNVFWGIHLKN